jgi:F-type H+-transporting ATPase subunit delta
MMKEVIAKRYAKALFEAIPQELLQRELNPTLEILEGMRQIFKTNENFRHLMLSPRFNREKKTEVLQSLLESVSSGQFSTTLVKFFDYLVRKNRFQYMPEISRAFSSLVNDYMEIITVPVRTAKEPSVEEKEQIQRGVESVTGRKVAVEWSVDPLLIGGMVAQVGEAVIDGSIKGKLETFRRILLPHA